MTVLRDKQAVLESNLLLWFGKVTGLLFGVVAARRVFALRDCTYVAKSD